MSDKKQERRETVTTEVGGQIYAGQLIISGTRKLYFTVEYNGKSHIDSRTWGTSSAELQSIRVMAKLHLMNLVNERDEIFH